VTPSNGIKRNWRFIQNFCGEEETFSISWTGVENKREQMFHVFEARGS
jgi:hypothetical protein